MCTWVQVPVEPQNIRPYKWSHKALWVTGCGSLEPNSRPPQKQCTLLAAEPFLQPHKTILAFEILCGCARACCCSTQASLDLQNDTYLFIDSLAENSQQEDSPNGWPQVAGDRLDVIKELSTLSRLHDGHPGDADGNQQEHEQPEIQAHSSTSAFCMDRHMPTVHGHMCTCKYICTRVLHKYTYLIAPQGSKGSKSILEVFFLILSTQKSSMNNWNTFGFQLTARSSELMHENPTLRD